MEVGCGQHISDKWIPEGMPTGLRDINGKELFTRDWVKLCGCKANRAVIGRDCMGVLCLYFGTKDASVSWWLTKESIKEHRIKKEKETKTEINKVEDKLWLVNPLCKKQLRDINPKDILEKGLYRKCSSYIDSKGNSRGGGYDRFPEVWSKRIGTKIKGEQFVVQLCGCPLECPYCYVTTEGIWGEPVHKSTGELVNAFYCSGQDIFHLMGGAPALYLEDWPELLANLGDDIPFHSDFLLVEKCYDKRILREIAKYKNGLYAVSIKGVTPEQFEMNTNTHFNETLFWNNLSSLAECGINFYITFTGIDKQSQSYFRQQVTELFPGEADLIMRDAIEIPIREYAALDQN